MSRLHPGPISNLFHRQLGCPGEKLGQQALVGRVKVLYEYQCHVNG